MFGMARRAMRMMGRVSLKLGAIRACGVVLAAMVGGDAMVSAAEAGRPLTYVDILHQLTDLDRLGTLQDGCRGGLFSSWDRVSHTVWGANGDAGHYLDEKQGGEAVMMDLDGPGVIYRIWSANPMGTIHIYLDGAQTPSYSWSFPDLFDGKLAPFVKPLVYRRDGPQSASDCYLPIPFAKHIRITADKAHAQYYHFNYVTLPKDQVVSSFHLPLSPEEQAALDAAVDAWSHPGRDPKPQMAGQKTIHKTVTVAPGKVVELCNLRETGVIRAIRARVISDQRYAWRKLVLKGVWDNAKWPQVLTPLGPFFGFDWQAVEYGSVPAGCRDGQAYQYFPMPFRKSATLAIQSFLEAPATVEFEIEWAPRERLPEDSTYFYARWRHARDLVRFDYAFLETAGRGHFVGVSMPIDHPLDGWWGEGDEMVWVDDDDFPPYIGTGSEDYFGDAWGIRYLSGPSFGASYQTGHRTANYRWHFMDVIPFSKRMRMTIENYGPNGQGPTGQYDYSSTAFWYQTEVTPPFEKLKGVRFTGGSDPAAVPVKMEYDPGVFSPITRENIRTYGRGITFARQAEVLLADSVKHGKGRIVTDALCPYEYDREQAVAFGRVEAGATLAAFTLSVQSNGVYHPRIHMAPLTGVAELSLEIAGKVLPVVGRPSLQEIELQGVVLAKGDHPVRLVALKAGEAIFDCLQLQPAKRVADAIEAEDVAVVRTTGDAPLPKVGDPVQGVSAGRFLEFLPTKAGQGAVLKPGKRPALPYVLGVRPLVGPDAGIIQGFVGGKAIGPQFDLHAAAAAPGPSILPLGSVPSGATEIEIRVVGRNPLSTGWKVGLDYFRWEPCLLGPGTMEGIWAGVIGRQDCNYQGQDLGESYSGGHQFWVMPCNLNSWIDVAIEIPRSGTREFVVKYTKSWDYARIQAFLDGSPLGAEVDTYAPTVVPDEPTVLGQRDLTAGRHVLRFQAVGHNTASQGYLMGIDHVIVK